MDSHGDKSSIEEIFNQCLEGFEPLPFDEIKTFGDFIKAEREYKDMTQSDLALKSGLSPSTICKLEGENYSYPPSAKAIAALAQALKADEYLLSLKAGRIPEELRLLLCSFLEVLETPEKARKLIELWWAAELVGSEVVIKENQ